MKYRMILTHPGGAHKDEFLACCLLVASYLLPIVRREPSAEDLADPSLFVVDVGGEHHEARSNFDHHHFPADHVPCCALTLIMKHLEIYDDAREFCEWLEPAEWFDVRGPNETAKWLGISRESLSKLSSPIDMTILRRFAQYSEISVNEAMWEIMRWIGEDLISYIKNLRQRLNFLAENIEIWPLSGELEGKTVVFLPRTDPMPAEPSSGIFRHIQKLPDEVKSTIIAEIYPDRRGDRKSVV